MKFDPKLPREEVNYTKKNLARQSFTLGAGLILLGGILAVMVALLVDLAVPYIPVSLEKKLFSGLFSLPFKNLTQEDRAVQSSLSNLLSRLQSHWPDNPYDFKIGILRDEKPNAMAIPGGILLVTSGLVNQVESENEVAFVIGHELGHFKNRDHLRGLGRGVALTFFLKSLSSSGNGSGTFLLTSMGNLTERKFNRQQEEAADEFGLHLVFSEYGHIENALDFFKKLPKPTPDSNRTLSVYWSTHPLSQTRIQTSLSFAQKMGWPTKGEQTPWLEESLSH